jgi:hypothetical protein
VVCDSYVRPATLVRICDECNYGSFAGRCVICGGVGISDAYYCKECTQQEKDVSVIDPPKNPQGGDLWLYSHGTEVGPFCDRLFTWNSYLHILGGLGKRPHSSPFKICLSHFSSHNASAMTFASPKIYHACSP